MEPVTSVQTSQLPPLSHQTPITVSSAAQQPITSCMSDFDTITSIATNQPPMVYPPTSMIPTPFDPSLPYELHASYVPPPALLPTAQFNEGPVESLEPIKILAEDRVTGATIQYYGDTQLPPPPTSVAEFPTQQFTALGEPSFHHHGFHDYPAAQPHVTRGDYPHTHTPYPLCTQYHEQCVCSHRSTNKTKKAKSSY